MMDLSYIDLYKSEGSDEIVKQIPLLKFHKWFLNEYYAGRVGKVFLSPLGEPTTRKQDGKLWKKVLAKYPKAPSIKERNFEYLIARSTMGYEAQARRIYGTYTSEQSELFWYSCVFMLELYAAEVIWRLGLTPEQINVPPFIHDEYNAKYRGKELIIKPEGYENIQ